jgi:hypothetical protein
MESEQSESTPKKYGIERDREILLSGPVVSSASRQQGPTRELDAKRKNYFSNRNFAKTHPTTSTTRSAPNGFFFPALRAPSHNREQDSLNLSG